MCEVNLLGNELKERLYEATKVISSRAQVGAQRCRVTTSSVKNEKTHCGQQLLGGRAISWPTSTMILKTYFPKTANRMSFLLRFFSDHRSFDLAAFQDPVTWTIKSKHGYPQCSLAGSQWIVTGLCVRLYVRWSGLLMFSIWCIHGNYTRHYGLLIEKSGFKPQWVQNEATYSWQRGEWEVLARISETTSRHSSKSVNWTNTAMWLHSCPEKTIWRCCHPFEKWEGKKSSSDRNYTYREIMMILESVMHYTNRVLLIILEC